MDSKVVEDDDISGIKLRAKHWCNVGGKDVHVRRSFDEERSPHVVKAKRRDKRQGFPVAMGHLVQTTIAHRAAPMRPGYFGVKRGLINEDQTPLVPTFLMATLPLTGRHHIRPVLLGGVS